MRHSTYFDGGDVGPDPIRVVLKSFCRGKAPPPFVKGYSCRGLPDAEHLELVEWVLAHARVSWATGISLVEAADTLVAEAVGNANIPPEEYWTEETLQEYRGHRARQRTLRRRKKERKLARARG